MGKRDPRLVGLSAGLERTANAIPDGPGEPSTVVVLLRLAARIARGYDGAKDVLAAYRTGAAPADWAMEATAAADDALREASRSAPTPPDPFRVGPGATDGP